MKMDYDSDDNSEERKVWFSRIVVYEHPYELGDNPSVSQGAPVTIAWGSQHTRTFDIGYYEVYRPSSKRKCANDLKLSVPERARLLLESGYSIDEIVSGSLEASTERQSRADSVKGMKWDGLHAAMETTSRKLKKVARRGSLLASAPVRMGRRASLAAPVEASWSKHTIQQAVDPPPRRRRNSMLGSAPMEHGMQNAHHARRRSSAIGSSSPFPVEEGPTEVRCVAGAAPRRRRNSMFGASPIEQDYEPSNHAADHGQRRRRNSMLGSTAAECATPSSNKPRQRRNSLLGSTPTECAMASNKPRQRRNSLLGSTPADCGTPSNNSVRRRRNSLLGSTPAECGTANDNPTRRRRNSLLGSTPAECGTANTTRRRRNSLLGSTPAECGGKEKVSRRRRNSLLGSTPAEPSVAAKSTKSCRRNSLLGNNTSQQTVLASIPPPEKSKRRGSLFGSSTGNPFIWKTANRRASLLNTAVPMESCGVSTVQHSPYCNTEPLTDMDACIVGPRSA